MRTLLISAICIISIISASAQRSYEMGVFGGVSYYTGDLNPGGHFNPAFLHPGAGLLLRRNLNSRYALRYKALYGKLSGNDSKGRTLTQKNRNLNFTSNLFELSAVIEFNFFKYVSSDENPYVSPYVFVGLAAFWFNPVSSWNGTTYQLQPLKTEGKKYSRIQPSMPFGTGIKFKLSHRLLFAIEWGLRKTWTDYIDDVSTTYRDNEELDDIAQELANRCINCEGPGGSVTGTQRGNSKTKDWYSFAGISMSFRLGERPNDCWKPWVRE